MFARMKTAHIAPLPHKRAACAFALNKRKVLLDYNDILTSYHLEKIT
jgi:hypothetical protein